MHPTSLNKLIHTVSRSKDKLQTQSKQRRGGVTDLYALDYIAEIRNLAHTETITTTETSPPSESDKEVAERVAKFARYVKNYNPSATPIGIAGVIGNFARESNVQSKRYEADHIVKNKYKEMDEEPTAEKLVGSWGAFQALYNVPLNEQGYLADGKHYIGIGLGQWTGPRGKMLHDFAKAKKTSIFDFATQVEFMFTKDVQSRIREAFKITSMNSSVEEATRAFLNNWEGVPGDHVEERISQTKKWLPVIEKALKGGKSSSDISELTGPNPSSATPTTVSSDVTIKTNTKSVATFRVLIPADLDRFQRWFIKIMVSALDEAEEDKGIALTDATLHIQATNLRSGKTINLDVTKIFRQKWACDWVGYRNSEEEVYPNNKPNEGFDIMDLAWYLTNDERDALFSAGEKVFTLRAMGNARVTLRNFLKFSHIN